MYLCLQRFKSYGALNSTEKYEGVYEKDNNILLCKCHSHSCVYRSPSLWKHLPPFIDTMLIVYCAFPSTHLPLPSAKKTNRCHYLAEEVSGTSTGKFCCISFRWFDRTALIISGKHDIMAIHVKYHHQMTLLYAYTVNTSLKPWATSGKVHKKTKPQLKTL